MRPPLYYSFHFCPCLAPYPTPLPLSFLQQTEELGPPYIFRSFLPPPSSAHPSPLVFSLHPLLLTPILLTPILAELPPSIPPRSLFFSQEAEELGNMSFLENLNYVLYGEASISSKTFQVRERHIYAPSTLFTVTLGARSRQK